jgi:hypothetical protein
MTTETLPAFIPIHPDTEPTQKECDGDGTDGHAYVGINYAAPVDLIRHAAVLEWRATRLLEEAGSLRELAEGRVVADPMAAVSDDGSGGRARIPDEGRDEAHIAAAIEALEADRGEGNA